MRISLRVMRSWSAVECCHSGSAWRLIKRDMTSEKGERRQASPQHNQKDNIKDMKKDKERPGLNANVTCNWRQGMLVTMARDLGTHLTSETARTGQGRADRSRGKPTDTKWGASTSSDQPYLYRSLSLWGLRYSHDKSL